MNVKNLIMWVIIVLLSVGLFNMFQDPNKINSERNSLAFSNFLNEVEAGRVVEVQIQRHNISGILADFKTFKTYSPNYPELADKLSVKGVSIVAAPQEDKMPSLEYRAHGSRCFYLLVFGSFLCVRCKVVKEVPWGLGDQRQNF